MGRSKNLEGGFCFRENLLMGNNNRNLRIRNRCLRRVGLIDHLFIYFIPWRCRGGDFLGGG